MKYLLISALMLTPVSAFSQEKYDWLIPPVKMKYFKQNAEGGINEGYEVTDKENKYTIVCRSTTGSNVIIEWRGAMRIEEINKKPSHYLNDVRGFSELKLKWAEACRKIIR